MDYREQIDKERLPRHIAIIMDGNGRWAKKQGLARMFGHKQGVETVHNITVAATKLGVEYLTLYTFSTENWNRPKEEVDALMTLLVDTIVKETPTLMNNNVRLLTIGDIERLPGLGLLPVSTTMSGEKVTRQVTSDYGAGYEIHMGETRPFGDAKVSPLLHLSDGRDDGYIVDNKCMGTYVHGILDNAPFIDFLLQPFVDKLAEAGKPFDYQAFKEEQYNRQYNRLADHVRKYVDIERLYQILTND